MHLTSSFPRHDGGHDGPYIAELARAQAAAGAEPMVLAPHAPGLDVDGTISGVPVHRFRYAPTPLEVLAYRGSVMSAARNPLGAAALPGFLAAFSAAARRLARSWRADVVHAHWWLPAGAAGVAAGIRPLLITGHGTDVHIARRPGLNRLARRVLESADVVAAVSEALAADMTAVAPAVDPVVLRMPFRPPGLPEAPLPSRDPGELTVLMVGRQFPEKGYDIALAAVATLASRQRPIRLQIMGDGPTRSDLERRAVAAGIADRIGFLPSGPRREMFGHIDAADAVLLPSRREGLGLVALDAISRGRPVIASAVGGLVETVWPAAPTELEEARRRTRAGQVVETPLGLLVPAGDVVAWATALERLPLWPRTKDGTPPPASREAAAEVLGRHDPERVAKEHLDVYEAARASRASRR